MSDTCVQLSVRGHCTRQRDELSVGGEQMLLSTPVSQVSRSGNRVGTHVTERARDLARRAFREHIETDELRPHREPIRTPLAFRCRPKVVHG